MQITICKNLFWHHICCLFRKVTFDGVVKTLYPESRRLAYLLRHCKFNVVTMYLSTPHSIKFVTTK